MRLGIVGAPTLAGKLEAYRAIHDLIERKRPTCLILRDGFSPGIGSMAGEIAAALDLPTEFYRPEGAAWSAIQDCGKLIAEMSDEVVFISSTASMSYGSGMTRDHAAEMGKPTEEIAL